MKTSKKGLVKIISHEGIVVGPYLDSVGVWTYGVGHTVNAGGIDPAKLPKVDTRNWADGLVRAELIKALSLYEQDLKKYEDRVNKAIKVPLKQHQFDALVSFDFNTGGIFKANLTKEINSGNFSGRGFMGWVRPKEIIGRRTAEQMLFITGDYEDKKTKVPVYDTTSTGKPEFRESMTSSELTTLMGVSNNTVVELPKEEVIRVISVKDKPNTFTKIINSILTALKQFLNP